MEEHTHSSVGAYGYYDGEKCEICTQMEDIEINPTKFIFQLIEDVKDLKQNNEYLEMKIKDLNMTIRELEYDIKRLKDHVNYDKY